jgi:hypothetical protein
VITPSRRRRRGPLGAPAAERAAGLFGFEIVYDDPDRKSVFATINEWVQATHEGDVPPPNSGGPMSSCLLGHYGIALLDVLIGLRRGCPHGRPLSRRRRFVQHGARVPSQGCGLWGRRWPVVGFLW